ncbi:MAG: OB-fold domain-containing protein [Myxococcota bacterium]
MILPEITPLTRPYWEGARARRLLLQSCRRCERVWHPPSPGCPHCGAPDPEWVDAGGTGRVHSFVVIREAAHPAAQGRLPVVVALVRLAEGPLFVCNLQGCAPEDVRVEMPVRVDFESITDEIVLPQFRPAG